MQLNKYLKLRRVELGLSQADLALRVGIGTPQQVCNYESGSNVVPPKHYKKIMQVLKIPKKEFKLLLLSDYENKINPYLEGQ